MKYELCGEIFKEKVGVENPYLALHFTRHMTHSESKSFKIGENLYACQKGCLILTHTPVEMNKHWLE
jgi:hypothetical protein